MPGNMVVIPTVRVDLDQHLYNIAPEKKGKYRFISTELIGGKAIVGRIESYESSVQLTFRTLAKGTSTDNIKIILCKIIPKGGTGPTFPVPDCPDKFPTPQWPLSKAPGPLDLLVIRCSGGGMKTSVATIANGNQLIQFIKGIEPELEQRIGSMKGLNGFSALNTKFHADPNFRKKLLTALKKAGSSSQGTQVSHGVKAAVKTKDVDEAVDDACSKGAAIPVVAAFCVGYTVGTWLRSIFY